MASLYVKVSGKIASAVVLWRKHGGGTVMTETQRRAAAREFARDWAERGDEKQDTQSFWLSLLQKVFGVEEPDKYIAFEVPVMLKNIGFVDALISKTNVLIEQKGRDVDLTKPKKQSDGSVLTPFEQAKRYGDNLGHYRNPRWVVVCNFQEFHIHDMNQPKADAVIVRLCDLEKEYYRLQFLVDAGNVHLQREMEVSIAAGRHEVWGNHRPQPVKPV